MPESSARVKSSTSLLARQMMNSLVYNITSADFGYFDARLVNMANDVLAHRDTKKKFIHIDNVIKKRGCLFFLERLLTLRDDPRVGTSYPMIEDIFEEASSSGKLTYCTLLRLPINTVLYSF